MEETNTDKRDELSKVGRKDGWEKDDDLSSHCWKKMRKKANDVCVIIQMDTMWRHVRQIFEF
jgi:hypothetical protein